MKKQELPSWEQLETATRKDLKNFRCEPIIKNKENSATKTLWKTTLIVFALILCITVININNI